MEAGLVFIGVLTISMGILNIVRWIEWHCAVSMTTWTITLTMPLNCTTRMLLSRSALLPLFLEEMRLVEIPRSLLTVAQNYTSVDPKYEHGFR